MKDDRMSKTPKRRQTFEDKMKKALNKKFHTLMSKLGMDLDDKAEILKQYDVTSSRELTPAQLIEICDFLDKRLNPAAAVLDKARKRVMAAIGKWLKDNGKFSDAKIIKGIACRAAGSASFNNISLTKLQAIYNTFGTKNKVKGNTDIIIEEYANQIISQSINKTLGNC